MEFMFTSIRSVPATPAALPLVGLGLGQPGQVKPKPNATIMQTLGASASRSSVDGSGRFGQLDTDDADCYVGEEQIGDARDNQR